jgi:hypothetical protein
MVLFGSAGHYSLCRNVSRLGQRTPSAPEWGIPDAHPGLWQVGREIQDKSNNVTVVLIQVNWRQSR